MSKQDEYWKFAESERHFNETQAGIRNHAATWMLAAFAASAILLKSEDKVNWLVAPAVLVARRSTALQAVRPAAILAAVSSRATETAGRIPAPPHSLPFRQAQGPEPVEGQSCATHRRRARPLCQGHRKASTG